jgi:hypothetical protein
MNLGRCFFIGWASVSGGRGARCGCFARVEREEMGLL